MSEHYCPECGYIGEPNSHAELNPTQQNTIAVFHLDDYEWISGGEYKKLYLIGNASIIAKDNEELFQEALKPEYKLLSIPTCPQCWSAAINSEFAGKNASVLLMTMIEQGKTRPIGSLLGQLGASLTDKKCYGTDNFGPVAAIVNGKNANDVATWLRNSEYWDDDCDMNLLGYASSCKFRDEEKQKVANLMIKQCIDNGAKWQKLKNFQMENVVQLYEAAEDPEDKAFCEILWRYYFKSSIG